MQAQPQTQFFDPETVPSGITVPDVSDLPSDLYFFFVVSQTSFKQANNKFPFILTYRDTNTTFSTFIDKYITDSFGKKNDKMDYYFVLGDESKIDPDMNAKDLLKMLGRERTDGVFLFARDCVKPLPNDDESQYINESAVTAYVQKKYFSKETCYEMRFATRYENQKSEEISYVPCKFSQPLSNTMEKYFAIAMEEFGLELNKDSIAEIFCPDATGNKNTLYFEMGLEYQKVYNSSTINVVLKNPNKLELKRLQSKKHDCELIVFKENESKPIIVSYGEISHLTFKDFYTNRLELEDSKNKKQAIYCLKVTDLIIKPHQKMNLIENLIVNKAMKLVANVVNEKMIFYNAIPKLREAPGGEFKIQDLNIPQNQIQKRDQCRSQSIRRSQKATHDHFKKFQHIQPIMIYTAELKFIEKQKNPQTIYFSLNQYLRDHQFIEMDEEALKAYKAQWRLRYASSLLRQLQVAQQITKKEQVMITWRGITYDPQLSEADIGKIITFKQFTSTSIKQSVAISFAKPTGNKQYHLLRLAVKTGISIIEYSIFKTQSEILLNPYTEFLLQKIEKQVINKQQFNIYYLQQIITPKEFPNSKENFIIWIDDKLKQGKQIYQQIKMPTATTIMEQIASTTELQGWLKDHRDLFKDPSVNLVFITNMTRKEGKNLNYFAGIEGAKKIRAVNETAPIFFYIGDLAAAKKKVEDSKLDQANIKIGNRVADIKEYLKKVLNLAQL